MSILVCFALKEEAAPFRKIAAGKSGIAILLTGIGRQNAEKSVRGFLAGNSPELVLSSGFAGGLNPDWKLGDVIFEIPSRGSRHEPPQIQPEQLKPASAGCRDLERRLISTRAKAANFFCAGRIATTATEKNSLRRQTGADAVEMESAAIHAVCAEKNLPSATVRVISDAAHEDLPLDFNTLARPDKSIDFGRLALAVAKSPAKIGALLALRKKTHFAAAQLAAVLEKICLDQP